MKKYTIAKGLFDILPYGAKEPWAHSHLWSYVENALRSKAELYGFEEIRTPIFEHAGVFSVGIGSTSDIVSKEMYTFEDKKKRLLALRPEGTSALLRAFFEKSLFQERKVHKLFYFAPMFRYEKPQAGRYRQHHQFGVEVLGSSSAEQDVEIIDLLLSFYQDLGLKGLSLHLNSVGDIPSREAYKKALKSYLEPYLPKLSKESTIRFSENILRILDTKAEEDQEILKNAPSILDYLSPDAKAHFMGVQSHLEALGISYEINPRIVRGLDYYQKTVFEITAPGIGSQNAIGAGGRYDGFPKLFSGQDLPGTGFGTGIERVIQTMLAQNCLFPPKKAPFVFFAPLHSSCIKPLFLLTKALRDLKIPAEIDLTGKKIQEQLKRANQLEATYTLLLGEDEKKQGTLQCKHMKTRTQEVITLQDACKVIEEKWKNRS